jgi:4-hydroxy-tetrahydrodipicolinate synthase
VIAYDIPSRTGTKIATETLLQLAAPPRTVGVKDAKYDVAATTKVLAETDLAYYCGADELNLAWLSIGAVGMISVVAHVAGDDYRAMVGAVDAGDLATAREIDRRLVPAVEAIMTRTQGVIMAKAALKLAGVLGHATTRPPLVDATPEQVDLLTTDLKSSGLLA